MPAVFATLASLMGAAGVALGAVAAHLTGSGPLGTASTFLLLHAGAVLALAAFGGGSRLRLAAQLCLLAGTLLFCGAISLDVLAGLKLSPSPAPWGGVLLILGWLLAALGFLPHGSVKRR